MSKGTRLAMWIVAIAALFADISTGQERLPVLDYLARRAESMAEQLPPMADTAEARKQQRPGIVRHLEDVLGLPEWEPMKAAVIDTRTTDDLIIEKVAFHWAERAYASASVIRSKDATGRQPAIVMPSGYLGHWTFLPYRGFVEQMAREGIVVMFVDDPRTGLRHAPPAGLYATAAAAGTQVAGIQTFDAIRAFDYLLTRNDVDPNKIGIAGWDAGAKQATMAAMLEDRFQFVVAAFPFTTVAATGPGPSAVVAGLLKKTDEDRIDSCLAPRPVLLLHSAGSEPTMDATKAADWLKKDVLPTLKDSPVETAACGEPEQPDFSMLRYLQRRIAVRSASLPTEPASQAAWQTHREQMVDWLAHACDLGSMTPERDVIVKTTEEGAVAIEQIVLGVDAGFGCPAQLIRPIAVDSAKLPAVVLSHDSRQCASTPTIAQAARQLAAGGYCVIVPDHASVNPQSLQPIANAESPSYYGDEAARFYGQADAAGLSPLALRVADNLAAFRHLAGRPEFDAEKIVLVGIGIGGVDACLAAVLEEKVAGAASVDAATMRDWAVNVAPGEQHFFDIMPYLPTMPEGVDLDCLYAAMAPRPLAVVGLKKGWPKTGFEQVAATAAAVYGIEQAEDALLSLSPRQMTDELQSSLPKGVHRQLVAAARTLVPTPPNPGSVGSPAVLASRGAVDSAVGLVWIVAEMGGYDQEFAVDGYELQSWSFFNDNGAAQKGHVITPLLFEQEGNTFVLTGIGKTRTNEGTGKQTFPFEPIAGTAAVGEGYFFGWHTGDAAGKTNSGTVEFGDAPDARMVILAPAGSGIQVGQKFQHSAQYARQYSITASAKKK